MNLELNLSPRQEVKEDYTINGSIPVKVHFFMDEFADFGIIANRYGATNDNKKKLQLYDKVSQLVDKMITVPDEFNLSLVNKIEILKTVGENLPEQKK